MESFHLIGIKGTGMSALTSILKDMGYYVTGSDVAEDFFTTPKLRKKNIEIYEFDKKNITSDKIYIASSIYDKDNPEVEEVFKNNYPFYYYHEFIEKFFKNKIGVSGTHGKTTTTSIIAKLFSNEKICYLIGEGTGAGRKDYDYFIFEACEYQDHFLKYTYDYLIINNIDFDHPDYFKNFDEVIKSFQKVAKNTKKLIINYDDINTKYIIHKNKLTFGFNKNADIWAEILETHNNGYTIKVNVLGEIYQFILPFTGEYMIYNFLAALGVYYLCGLDFDLIQDLIITYKKPSRRMEEHLYYDNIIIDDYAHHPKEIDALFQAIKQKHPTKELIVIFQPHTYSRTLALENEFREVFKDVNLYLASTFTSKRERYNKDLERQIFNIFSNAKPFSEKDIKYFKTLNNKVILFLGAGNIDKYIGSIIGKM